MKSHLQENSKMHHIVTYQIPQIQPSKRTAVAWKNQTIVDVTKTAVRQTVPSEPQLIKEVDI